MRTFRTLLILILALGGVLSLTAGGVRAYGKPDGFLTVNGTRIVDSSDRKILLRGINYPGYDSDLRFYGTLYPSLHSREDYRAFAERGFNVVRLQISWVNFEFQPGMFDWGYLLQRVNQDIQWAKQFHIYVVLAMMQQEWSTKLVGVSARDWTVSQYPASAEGLREAVSNFWVNASLQDHLARTWQEIARTYANETTIAGYDILNEPWIYTSIIPGLNSSYVDAFYTRVIAAIDRVDTNHIFFLEPSNMPDNTPPFKDRIVWSPHFYPLSFASKFYLDNYTFLEDDFMVKYQTYVIDYGTPMWIGEFGAFMPDNSSRAIWIQVALDFFNRYEIGWGWLPYDGQSTSIPDQLYIPS